ncbi:MAG: hypothetical protein GW903_04080 [Alphaproteobacteria bacterium]|nr:hypothetical protein [Alphaproteobacteria bacterium]NCQ88146.1 hypothetical protein [Alphaproteobacteria bacterium]NCT05347.1 hypothetical protein [Alphaproteobacteria bacterium]
MTNQLQDIKTDVAPSRDYPLATGAAVSTICSLTDGSYEPGRPTITNDDLARLAESLGQGKTADRNDRAPSPCGMDF